MNAHDVETSILQALYEAFFRGDGVVNLDFVNKQLGFDAVGFWNVVDQMSHRGLIEEYALGGSFVIKPRGVLEVERNGGAPADLFKENQRVRTVILATLAQVYEESGSYADTPLSVLSDKAGTSVTIIANNLQVLEGIGFVEAVASGTDKITDLGLKAVRDWQERSSMVDEFERISLLSSQPRGRELQEFLATVLGKHGWSQEEGVQTSNEEMDIIVFKDREYYLVECKWEKEPIEAPVVRELYGKLGNRVGVRGIIISMSSFTKGAAKQGEDYTGSAIILFFGPFDIRSLVDGSASFEDLLNQKYQRLVTVRRVVFA